MSHAQQVILPPIRDEEVLAQIEKLARRYVEADGLSMQFLNAVGGRAENLLEKLPRSVRGRMDKLTERGLNRAFDAARTSRGLMRDRGDMFNRLTATMSGAAGGLGGLAGAALEMPVTITLMLRAMLDIAAEHGLDPDSDEVRLECLRVFADAGPGSEDDGADLGLLATRLTLTGKSVHGLIARVAPRLSAAMGQKLAAQAAPVLGAFAGASINFTFVRYYQELARVHFGIMRLSNESDIPHEALIEALEAAIAKIRRNRSLARG